MRTSMQLAGENLLRVLDSRQNYLPYRMVDVNSRYQGWFQFFQPGHNVGRWWDAMLRLEAATGFQISADIEGAMLENMHLYFDNTEQSVAVSAGVRVAELHCGSIVPGIPQPARRAACVDRPDSI